MGLDQYLTKKTYIGAEYEHRRITGKIEIYQDGKPVHINFNKVSYITETAGYWRKANQIHNWFVSNVQYGIDDCGKYEVTKGQLKELLELCIKIRNESVLMKAKIKSGTTYQGGKETPIIKDGKVIVNTQIAEELLPTTKGFFFGSTDYDQYYMEDIEDTIEILTPLLKENDNSEVEYYYQSSW